MICTSPTNVIPGGSAVKSLPANTGDLSSIPGSGRSLGEGMATHSSILAWEIPWSLVGYSPWGSKESNMTQQPKNNNLRKWNVSIYKLKKKEEGWLSGYGRMAEWRWRVDGWCSVFQGDQESLLKNENSSGDEWWWWLHKNGIGLNATELHT